MCMPDAYPNYCYAAIHCPVMLDLISFTETLERFVLLYCLECGIVVLSLYYIQWGQQVFSQPLIVQVLLLRMICGGS